MNPARKILEGTSTYYLLPSGALAELDQEGQPISVTYGNYSAQLNSFEFGRGIDIEPKPDSLALHLALYSPDLVSNQLQKDLGDFLLQFNQLYPEAKPLEIPQQRFYGEDLCPLNSGAMAWNGIWGDLQINYWIFPTGQVYYFEDGSLKKIFYPTPAQLCSELESVIELEFQDPDLNDLFKALSEMEAYTVASDQWAEELQTSLNWLNQVLN